ncbi:MAG: hypothetical protein HYV77_02215 [Candidatus Wildermuthbacteria bacterium]|nr:hypothetical protein [Candidatus Wildermuthbacteria bacterium]
MAKQSDTITISKKYIEKRGGVVILGLKEYQKLCEQAAPIYQLHGKEAKELDELVREGMREYKAGKTTKIKSLNDLA